MGIPPFYIPMGKNMVILVSYDLSGKQDAVKNRLCSTAYGYLKEMPLVGGGTSSLPDTIVHLGTKTTVQAYQDVQDAAAAEGVKVTRCAVVEFPPQSSQFLKN
jgi:hypothetical protein